LEAIVKKFLVNQKGSKEQEMDKLKKNFLKFSYHSYRLRPITLYDGKVARNVDIISAEIESISKQKAIPFEKSEEQEEEQKAFEVKTNIAGFYLMNFEDVDMQISSMMS
jgi:hypothetical protein